MIKNIFVSFDEQKTIYIGSILFFLALYININYTWLEFSPYFYFSVALCLAIGAIFSRNKFMSSIIFIGAFLFLGLGNGARVGLSAGEQLQPFFAREVVAYGRIDSTSVQHKEKYTSLILECSSLQVGGKMYPYTGKLRLALAKDIKVPVSGTLVVSGTAQPLIGLRNPGSFNSDLYNRINNIGGVLKKARLIKLEEQKDVLGYLTIINRELRQKISNVVGKDLGALLGGMLVGGSNNLSEATREIFTANGLTHLLSVSGSNLVLLAALLKLMLPKFLADWRKLIIIAFLNFYACLCGMQPPVMRALLMSSIFLIGGSGGRRGLLLSLTMVILLIYKPLWLLDVGFQLSCSATAGLIWLLQPCMQKMPQAWPECIRDGLAVTLAAQLGSIPLLVIYFHQISLISLISNLFLVPILEIAALLALLGALLPFADILLRCAGFLLSQLLVQAEWLTRLPYSTVTIGTLPWWTYVLYYVGLLVWLDLGICTLLSNWQRRCCLFCCIVLMAGVLLWQQTREENFTMYFLDVGQGDCTIITTPERQVYVFDTGGLANLATGSRIVAPFLRSLGYSTIDALLLSHYDYDHAGGAISLLRNCTVKEIVLPREELTPASSLLQDNLRQQAEKSGVEKITVADQGRSWQYRNGKMLVLDVPTEAVSGNEASTLLSVQYGKASILLTGDMGVEREQTLSTIGNYTVLKAGHHGSAGSSSSEFLARVQPRLSIISCGIGNRYGHPQEETLRRLEACGSKILRTDKLGCIKLVFKPEGVEGYSYKNYTWRQLLSSTI